jgi:hypothetical protein
MTGGDRPLGGFDEPYEFEEGIDGCHHHRGFDEDCEDCEDEMLIEALRARHLARLKKQPDLFEDSGSDSTAEPTK